MNFGRTILDYLDALEQIYSSHISYKWILTQFMYPLP
jgi:hypothetical protein